LGYVLLSLGALGGERRKMIIDASRSRVEELYREFEAAKQAEKQMETQMKKNRLRLVHRQDGLAEAIQQMPEPSQDATTLKDTLSEKDDVVETQRAADEQMSIPSAGPQQVDSLREEQPSALPVVNEWGNSNQFELLQNLLALMNMVGNSDDNGNSKSTEAQNRDAHSERTAHMRAGNSADGSFRDLFDFFNSDTLKVISEYTTREYITAEEYLAIHSLPFDSNFLLVLLGVREYVGEPRASYIGTFLRVLNAVELVTSGEINEFIRLFSDKV
jgi:hypothetical protein